MNEQINIEQPLFEPKLTNRFLVEFDEQINIPSFAVQYIDFPRFYVDRWTRMQIDFIDPITPSVSKELYKVVKSYNSSNLEKTYKLKIKILDPTNNVVETWVIEFKRFFEINFGAGNYDDNNPVKPYISFEPIDCKLS